MPRQEPAQVGGLGGADPAHGVPGVVKNTAIDSHAGPVGSSTTTPRQITLASLESTRTVWALVVPRSIPTSRRLCMPAPCGRAQQLRRSDGSACRLTTVPRWLRPTTAPLMCCNRPRPGGSGHFPHPGHPWPGQRWQSGVRGSAHAPSLEPLSTPPRTSRDAHATLGPWCGSSTAVPLHEPYAAGAASPSAASATFLIGAMVVGPEFGPIAGLAVALVQHRAGVARKSPAALAVGFPVAIAAPQGASPGRR
jgi:hypothetical protein